MLGDWSAVAFSACKPLVLLTVQTDTLLGCNLGVYLLAHGIWVTLSLICFVTVRLDSILLILIELLSFQIKDVFTLSFCSGLGLTGVLDVWGSVVLIKLVVFVCGVLLFSNYKHRRNTSLKFALRWLYRVLTFCHVFYVCVRL